MFSCAVPVTRVLTSLDGICKPEVEITKTGNSNNWAMCIHFNVISAATTQFSDIPDPLPSVPTSSDYGEHHQVQTGSRVPQTGSTNNYATKTDIDAISVAITMF